jgi:acyl-CoA hydrolase
VKERAKALIDIAHPEFRDQLTFEAKKNGWL